jgi:hypothetical protein
MGPNWIIMKGKLNESILVGAMAALISFSLVGPARITAQAPSPPAKTSSAEKKSPPAKNWTHSRTPDGQPDFQGVWAIATLTPLERPPELADKPFFTEQEAAAYERQMLQQVNTDRRGQDGVADLRGNYNEFWRDRGTTIVASRRTSLIVDPPDGKIPPLTAEAKKRRAGRGPLPVGPEDLALRIRCITRGLPMVPTPNNNFFQIVQGAGYVSILQEMMYEARIIALDGRPHAPGGVRAYMGDARGRWEGNTLVIDTTNFIGHNDFYGADENLHLTERLTRTDADTILYTFTVDDPTAFTKPWSGEIPMRKSTEGIFDYECHEGNYSIVNILAGARAAEKKAAEQGTPRP